ncbi:hypothetical protein KAFR_0H00880 [Kazachstania africana CBS 2517]|uniref:Mediator of RNA polymerase II transcription subunit 1 n=1 Tax=Kazachstania africana (strain ATCC 22294 / BCRC 22015 / CBS 2517 / CECT 1963 / NBRC 1671 / NRRL Y-8276) TaxID=1071382 RepID=H2AYU2_KAZAF|nr:hypothetical protein KAFR_0H00880 [Kazachstania africana CBS 2517]CCF59498.1 hypothetical protein KAFR_0H00880 [Kazachstania africana CBS 2517]
MAVDSYVQTLGEIVELFKEYKPGSITLDNITKLCQTLGLESFTEEIDSEVSRLSTASKIIVIDIDFNNNEERVKDVKLVLASSFDDFDYFNARNNEASKNILYNSLTQYPDLKEFHHNLQFLCLLDAFSRTEIDATHSNSNNTSGHLETSTSSSNNTNTNTASGTIDLFRYFTELSGCIKQYFEDSSLNLNIATNLNNRFGIYILDSDNETILAKIGFEKALDPKQRLYEYVYSKETKCWINGSPKNYTTGVKLVMELNEHNKSKVGDSVDSFFPKDYIPSEVILAFEKVPEESDFDQASISTLLSKHELNYRIKTINDFTATLIKIKKFDISNSNIELLHEILRWIIWVKYVFKPLIKIINSFNEFPNEAIPNINSSFGRRRRSSTLNKRPSITEATMLKEQGLQQYNLHEIIAEPAIQEESAPDSSFISNSDDILMSDAAELDFGPIIENRTTAKEENEDLLQLVLSEDHILLDNKLSCSLYDDFEKWNSFIEDFQKYVKK